MVHRRWFSETDETEENKQKQEDSNRWDVRKECFLFFAKHSQTPSYFGAGVKVFAENRSYVMTSLHLGQLKTFVVPKPPLQSLI